MFLSVVAGAELLLALCPVQKPWMKARQGLGEQEHPRLAGQGTGPKMRGLASRLKLWAQVHNSQQGVIRAARKVPVSVPLKIPQVPNGSTYKVTRYDPMDVVYDETGATTSEIGWVGVWDTRRHSEWEELHGAKN